eukprot:4032465-Amphidinium_carterae.1
MLRYCKVLLKEHQGLLNTEEGVKERSNNFQGILQYLSMKKLKITPRMLKDIHGDCTREIPKDD